MKPERRCRDDFETNHTATRDGREGSSGTRRRNSGTSIFSSFWPPTADRNPSCISGLRFPAPFRSGGFSPLIRCFLDCMKCATFWRQPTLMRTLLSGRPLRTCWLEPVATGLWPASTSPRLFYPGVLNIVTTEVRKLAQQLLMLADAERTCHCVAANIHAHGTAQLPTANPTTIDIKSSRSIVSR